MEGCRSVWQGLQVKGRNGVTHCPLGTLQPHHRKEAEMI